MKRKLTKQESKLCKEGINTRKKRIAELNKELKYFEEFNAFQDKWKSYLEDKEKKAKEQKEFIVKNTLKKLKEAIEIEVNGLKANNNQLKNGVEVKKNMVGVE